MRITKWGEYGILCSLQLAKDAKEKPCGAAQLAAGLEIPVDYAHQILQRLKNGNIVKSIRGPGGGYQLSRPAEEINLRDVLFAAEGDTFQVICDTKTIFQDCCETNRVCALRGVWHELKDTIDTLLSSKTLDALLREEEAAEAELVTISSHSPSAELAKQEPSN